MKKCLIIFILFLLSKGTSFANDTTTYISSACLYEVKKSGIIHQSGSPTMVLFGYYNDTLTISGMIEANCGSAHIAVIEKSMDTIFIIGEDTGKMTTCDCVFHFELKIKASVNDTIVVFNSNTYNTKHPYGLIGKLNIDNDPINLFPNPAENYLRIKTQANININRILISDITGRLIKTIINENKIIDLTGFNAGTYFIEFEINKGIHFYKKILKN